MISVIKVQIIGLLLVSTTIYSIYCDTVMFTQCKERIGTAKNINVEFNKSNYTECCESFGQGTEIILKFTPSKDSSAEVERLIVAQIPSSKNKLIEIPYAETVDIINNTFFENDGQKFKYPIRKETQLVHKYVFTMSNDDLNSPVSIRFIIREKIENLIRNQRNWRNHPGAIIVCVNIQLTSFNLNEK